MDKPKLKYQIFDLNPSKFEDLCYDLLKAEYAFDKAFITDGPNDNGVDILGLKGNVKIAIQVKHKFQIEKKSLRQEIEKYKHLLENHHRFIFITSAQIDRNTINEYESEKITIISQVELIKLLDKHSDIAKRYFTIIEQKNRSIKNWLTTSSAGVIISIMALIFSLLIDKNVKDKPLTSRIDNVEQALQNIKGLEKDLAEIKEDMIKTDIENKRILDEYEKIKGLETIINDKKESLNLVLNYEPWYKKILNYMLGIVTGIFSSVVATILWSKWKLYKTLKN